MSGDGRSLTVRFTDLGLWHRWVLIDPAIGQIAESRIHLTRQSAADEARAVFGGWLGDSVSIDMQRADGTWERLR